MARRPEKRRHVAHLWLGGAVLCCVVLAVWPPESTRWYPVCPFLYYFHIVCPGCGAARAISALLRGRLGDALRWNAAAVVLLPFAFAAGLERYRRAIC